MSAIKDQIIDFVQRQPEESSFDEIIRELAFSSMIERGLADADAGRIKKNSEVDDLINSWQK